MRTGRLNWIGPDGSWSTDSQAARLTEIRNELLRMIEAERSIYDRMLKLFACGTIHSTPSPRRIREYLRPGTVNILNHTETGNIGPVRELFRMLEEKGALLKILNECIACGTSPASGSPSARNWEFRRCVTSRL
jgi:transcriptional regulator of heat shock response